MGKRGRPAPTEPSTRDAAIVRAYEGGKTLRELGEAYNLHHERIRQIINQWGPGSMRPAHVYERRKRRYERLNK